MRKFILRLSAESFSPGDVVLMTAAVRDLYNALYSTGVQIDVRDTVAPALWDNNPLLTAIDDADPSAETLDILLPAARQANLLPWHYIHGFRMDLEKQTKVAISAGAFHGDIYLSDAEKNGPGLAVEVGYGGPYWVLVAGGKYDMTTKWWNPESYQKVIDKLQGQVKFVRVGADGDWHPPLTGVIDLVGATTIRQLVRLIYHAEGVVCPVTFAMHLAAAVPPRAGYFRPCVVIAGGREPSHWEAYMTHRFLHTCGALPCNTQGGCWRARCQPVGDGHPFDEPDQLCTRPVEVAADLVIPRCMEMIKPHDVVREVRTYYRGSIVEDRPFLEAGRSFCVLHMRRAGGHPVMNWIASNAGGDNRLFFNCINNQQEDGKLKVDVVSSVLPTIPERQQFKVAIGKKQDVILYSFEQRVPAEVDDVTNVVSSDHRRVLILRDVYNNLASAAEMGRWSKDVTPSQLAGWLSTWKVYTREFIDVEAAADPSYVAINYNRWLADEAYRDALFATLDLMVRTDEALPQVPGQGKGSSFDGLALDGKAATGKYLDRWQEYADVDWYKAAFKNDPELVALSDQIFGHLAGTETLTA